MANYEYSSNQRAYDSGIFENFTPHSENALQYFPSDNLQVPVSPDSYSQSIPCFDGPTSAFNPQYSTELMCNQSSVDFLPYSSFNYNAFRDYSPIFCQQAQQNIFYQNQNLSYPAIGYPVSSGQCSGENNQVKSLEWYPNRDSSSSQYTDEPINSEGLESCSQKLVKYDGPSCSVPPDIPKKRRGRKPKLDKLDFTPELRKQLQNRESARKYREKQRKVKEELDKQLQFLIEENRARKEKFRTLQHHVAFFRQFFVRKMTSPKMAD